MTELDRLGKTWHEGSTLVQLLRRPALSYSDLPKRNQTLDVEIVTQVEIMAKYAGYVERQEFEVNRLKSMEEKNIPISLDYRSIPSLRTEARQKLESIRPRTIAQASRISGVSPADIGLLMVWMKRSTN